MYALKYPAVWLGGGAGLIALVIYGSLTSVGPPMPVQVSDKLTHFLAYLILMLWFGGIFKRANLFWVLIALFVFGVGLELLQNQTDVRVYENMDIVVNGLGLAVGKKLCRMGLSGWCQKLESQIL